MNMLTIRDAVYRYKSKTMTIPHLSITPNKHYAFVGSNGSGKTALANVLANKQIQLVGTVDNQFKRIVWLSFEQLQKLIGDEWQRNNTDLIATDEGESGRTVTEIILEGYNGKDHACYQHIAQQFDIEHLLTRKFKHLSTGEIRKALLCRALIGQPDLFILEEPFDGLDHASQQQLLTLLNTLSSQPINLVLILNRFDEIPLFVNEVGILVDCELVKMGERTVILADELIKQIAKTEVEYPITLPPSDRERLTLSETIPRIILRHGYVHYNDKMIINDLNWQVNADENWQIVGPNGAGKSTLLSLITGDHPQGYSNDLTLFGRRRGSGETIWQIKQYIGYVSNQLHLDYRVITSVRNVILSGYFDSIGVYEAVSDKQRNLAEQWLALLSLTAKADQPFHALSWGQQRLVLIVRALVKHPVLLILDEPLQGLDSLNRELVKRWISYLIDQKQTQLLFVSHYVEDAPSCITHRLNFIAHQDGEYHYSIDSLKM